MELLDFFYFQRCGNEDEKLLSLFEIRKTYFSITIIIFTNNEQMIVRHLTIGLHLGHEIFRAPPPPPYALRPGS